MFVHNYNSFVAHPGPSIRLPGFCFTVSAGWDSDHQGLPRPGQGIIPGNHIRIHHAFPLFRGYSLEEPGSNACNFHRSVDISPNSGLHHPSGASLSAPAITGENRPRVRLPLAFPGTAGTMSQHLSDRRRDPVAGNNLPDETGIPPGRSDGDMQDPVLEET